MEHLRLLKNDFVLQLMVDGDLVVLIMVHQVRYSQVMVQEVLLHGKIHQVVEVVEVLLVLVQQEHHSLINWLFLVYQHSKVQLVLVQTLHYQTLMLVVLQDQS